MSSSDGGPLEVEEGKLEVHGETILWRQWSPAKPRGALLIIHGLAEHSGRYGFVVDHFTARGYACWSFDLRGHGLSTGLRVHVDRFDEYQQEVTAVYRLLRQHHGEDLPVYLVGHSMGGQIALRYILALSSETSLALSSDELLGIAPHKPPAGAILSSPAIGGHPDLDPNPILGLVARLLSIVAPRTLFPTDLDASTISRDPAVVEAYRNDPLVGGKVSARWFTEIRRAMKNTLKRADDLGLPVLLMQSGDDRLVDAAASRRFADAAPAQHLEYVEWEGLFHEMFNEPEREEVFERMERWLGEQAAH